MGGRGGGGGGVKGETGEAGTFCVTLWKHIIISVWYHNMILIILPPFALVEVPIS